MTFSQRLPVRTTTGLLAAACCTLLAGCVASPTPSSAPSVPAAPESSSPAEPSSSPSPSPSDDEDPAGWVIDFGHVGPIDVGGSLAEERTVLASFTETTDTANCPTVAAFESADSATVWLPLEDGVDVIEQVLITRYRSEGEQVAGTPVPTTDAGIGIGSTEADLIAAHPDIEPPSGDVSLDYTLTDGSDGFIHFTVAQGAVSEIAVSADPVPSYEVCA